MQVYFMCIFYIYKWIQYKWVINMKMAFHKKTEKKYIQYTLRLEEDILEKIREISKNEEISVNEVVNQSLKFAIDNYEKR